MPKIITEMSMSASPRTRRFGADRETAFKGSVFYSMTIGASGANLDRNSAYFSQADGDGIESQEHAMISFFMSV